MKENKLNYVKNARETLKYKGLNYVLEKPLHKPLK